MPQEFVHLHVHTQYSLLESAIRVKDLPKRTLELGMNAVAITDHGNMHGVVDFYTRATAAGVKPLLGCELAVMPPGERRVDKSGVDRTHAHHVVLLARTQQGYKNLVTLVSEAWLEVQGGQPPRASLEQLAARSKGLVVLSGCLGGLIPQAIMQISPDHGKQLLGQLRDACEPGSLFVELQDHGLVEQPVVNRILVEQAKALGLPYVATNDAHYLQREDAIAHKLLGCIATGITVDQSDAQDHGSREMFLKAPFEMAVKFREWPEALSNTVAVADMCESVDPTAKPMLPRFRDADGNVVADVDNYFARLAREGLEKRFARLRRKSRPVDEPKYRERLETEIAMIGKMGFAGYFLIVADFINWAKTHDVPVGPGRGSGAGSIVAWALGITDIDPIPYNLLFERFLNPDRVSMPDFDVDFCMLKRERVIEYVRKKYGEHSVGQIATFSMMKSRSAVRDVGRALGVPLAEVDAIAKLVPEPVLGKSVTIAESIEKEPRLRALHNEGGVPKQLLDYAQKLENLNRHAGIHAAGIVISDGPLWDTVPIFRGSNGEIVTQYAKDEVEAAGLVKFDFLGLTTLTVLDTAMQLVRKRPDERARVDGGGDVFDVVDLTLDDPATYALLQSGATTGVFQLESSGMQKLFRDLKPDRFEDIVAAVALYRPGPLGSGMVEDFVARKNGRQKLAYPHPDLAEILQDTYGVITYQEQVMMVARKMGGYSLGKADLLRRAMGKKKAEEMAKQKSSFVDGALELKYSREDAEKIFDLLEYFAGYGFNKSHSAAYALITYHTAYLKAHFPVEFMCATLTSDVGKLDKAVGTIAEARAMGIPVLAPDVNESDRSFAVVYESQPVVPPKKSKTRVDRDAYCPRIRFGLGGIKGVGEAAIEAIIEARKDGGFRDMFDFCSRVDIRRVNKAVMEALVGSGAFDDSLKRTGASRAQAVAAIDQALDRGRGAAKERASGQMGLFGATEVMRVESGYPEVTPWDMAETMRRERASLGFYLSGHPLDRYASEVSRVADTTTVAIADARDGTEVVIAGVVENYRERVTKTGGRMAIFQLEDRGGRVEVFVRPKMFAQLAADMGDDVKRTVANAVLREGDAVLVTGKVTIERRRDENGELEALDEEEQIERKIALNAVTSLANALQTRARSVGLKLRSSIVTDARLRSMRTALSDHPGKCPVLATLELPEGPQVNVALPASLRVDASEALMASLERIFGEKVVEIR